MRSPNCSLCARFTGPEPIRAWQTQRDLLWKTIHRIFCVWSNLSPKYTPKTANGSQRLAKPGYISLTTLDAVVPHKNEAIQNQTRHFLIESIPNRVVFMLRPITWKLPLYESPLRSAGRAVRYAGGF